MDELYDARERTSLVDMVDDCGFVEAMVGFAVLLLDNINGLAINFGRGGLLDKNRCTWSKRGMRDAVRITKASEFAIVFKCECDVEDPRFVLNPLDGRIDHCIVRCIQPGDEGV